MSEHNSSLCGGELDDNLLMRQDILSIYDNLSSFSANFLHIIIPSRQLTVSPCIKLVHSSVVYLAYKPPYYGLYITYIHISIYTSIYYISDIFTHSISP